MEATHGASGLRLFLSQFLHSIAFVAVSRYDWGVHVPRWCRRRALIRKDHIQGIKHESFPASCTLFILVDALIACMFWETRTTTETQIGAQMCQWLSVNGVILAGRRSYSSFLLAWSICQCWGRHWWFGAPVELHVMIQIAVTPCPFLWSFCVMADLILSALSAAVMYHQDLWILLTCLKPLSLMWWAQGFHWIGVWWCLSCLCHLVQWFGDFCGLPKMCWVGSGWIARNGACSSKWTVSSILFKCVDETKYLNSWKNSI